MPRPEKTMDIVYNGQTVGICNKWENNNYTFKMFLFPAEWYSIYDDDVVSKDGKYRASSGKTRERTHVIGKVISGTIDELIFRLFMFPDHIFRIVERIKVKPAADDEGF